MLSPSVREARWRRLDSYLAVVQQSSNDGSNLVPDAVAPALDEIYGLWEAWSLDGKLTFVQQDQFVDGDPEAETAAALVFARGGKTHAGIEFGNLLGFGTMPFGTGPFGGAAWYWQPYSDPKPRYARRNGWYQQHVSGKPVAPVLADACRWFRTLPAVKP